jgi:hypothetical protein
MKRIAVPQTFLRSFSPNNPLGITISMTSTTT